MTCVIAPCTVLPTLTHLSSRKKEGGKDSLIRCGAHCFQKGVNTVLKDNGISRDFITVGSSTSSGLCQVSGALNRKAVCDVLYHFTADPGWAIKTSQMPAQLLGTKSCRIKQAHQCCSKYTVGPWSTSAEPLCALTFWV